MTGVQTCALPIYDNQIHLNDALARVMTLKTDYAKEWYDNHWYCDYNDGLLRYLMMSVALVRSADPIELVCAAIGFFSTRPLR